MISIDEELAALRAENARLRAEQGQGHSQGKPTCGSCCRQTARSCRAKIRCARFLPPLPIAGRKISRWSIRACSPRGPRPSGAARWRVLRRSHRKSLAYHPIQNLRLLAGQPKFLRRPAREGQEGIADSQNDAGPNRLDIRDRNKLALPPREFQFPHGRKRGFLFSPTLRKGSACQRRRPARRRRPDSWLDRRGAHWWPRYRSRRWTHRRQATHRVSSESLHDG